MYPVSSKNIFNYSTTNNDQTTNTYDTPSFQNISLSNVLVDNNSDVLSINPVGYITQRSDIVDLSSNQIITNKSLDTLYNTINVTSGDLLHTNINNVLNQQLRKSDTPTFAQVNSYNIRTSNIYDQAGGDTVNINGDTAVNKSNLVTLSSKTIDTNNNTININTTSITDIISPLNPVLSTSNVTHNNIIANGYIQCKGPKISPLPTVECVALGIDTQNAGRVAIFGDPVNSGYIGSLVFSDVSGTSQYIGALKYNVTDNQLEIYLNSQNFPSAIFNPSYFNQTAIRCNVINDNAGGNSTRVNGILVDLNSDNTKTLSNKTIDSVSNTVNINGVNVNNIISGTNPVLSSSSPTFAAEILQSNNANFTVQDPSGRTGLMGICSNANAWFSTAATGDLAISNRSNGRILMGMGNGAVGPVYALSSSSAVYTVPVTTTWIESSVIVSGTRGANNITGATSTLTVSGSAFAFTMSLTTSGGGINAVGIIATITFNIAAPDNAFVVCIQPKNAATAAIQADLYVTNISSSQFTISNVTTPLTNNTAYSWGVICMS